MIIGYDVCGAGVIVKGVKYVTSATIAIIICHTTWSRTNVFAVDKLHGSHFLPIIQRSNPSQKPTVVKVQNHLNNLCLIAHKSV